MTKTKLFFITIFCAFLSIQLTSCGGDGDDSPGGGSNEDAITGVTLDQSTLSVEKGGTESINAIIAPLGATGTVVWSSSDESIATVDGGVVSGIVEGTATVVASVGVFTATCDVTVTPKQLSGEDETLKGSDYYVIQIGDQAYEAIQDKVVLDFRTDEVDKFLFNWDETFSAGNTVGNNFYGVEEGWVSFVVNNIGWSGAGYSVGDGFGEIDMTDLFDNPEDYYLHIGLKTGQASSSYLFILTDGVTEAKVAIGDDFNDNGTIFTSYQQLVRDNEWNSIEIPVTHLNTLGLHYNQPFQGVNIIAFLAGGIQGTTMNLDSVFFYKKAK